MPFRQIYSKDEFEALSDQERKDFFNQPSQRIAAPTTTPIRPVKKKKTVGGFFKNIFKSGANLVKDIGTAVINPLDTAKAVGGIALGGASKFVPGRQKSEDKFDAAVDFYKQRYGSIDKIKETVFNDPVGAAADLAAIFTGGGAAATKIGTVGKIGKVTAAGKKAGFAARQQAVRQAAKSGRFGSAAKAGETIRRAGEIIDPFNVGAKITKKVVKPVVSKVGFGASEALGVTTNAGGSSIRRAFEDPKGVRPALSGKIEEGNIVLEARKGLGELVEQRGKDYAKALDSLESDIPGKRITFRTKDGQLYVKKPSKELGGKDIFTPTNLTLQGVKSVITRSLKDLDVIDPKSGKVNFARRPSLDSRSIQQVVDIVDGWDDITPVGLNRLRQELRGFRKGGVNLAPSDKRFNKFLTDAADNLTKYVGDRVPQIKKMNNEFIAQSKVIDELQETLRLGNNIKAETQLNTLIRSLKTNNELRTAMVKLLDKQTGRNLESTIAGLNLKGIIPRSQITGLFGAGGGFVVGSATASLLKVLPILTIFSPRVIGEFASALGYGKKVASRATKFVSELQKNNPALSKVTSRKLFQAGRITEETKDEFDVDALKDRLGLPQ